MKESEWIKRWCVVLLITARWGIYIYIRFNSLPLQQHRFHFKQHCICNLNILRLNPIQQLRVTLSGYFTIHWNTVNVVAPFRQCQLVLCCYSVTNKNQHRWNITKNFVCNHLSPPTLTTETTETALIVNFFCELANRLFDFMNSQFLVVLCSVLQGPASTCWNKLIF